MSNALAGGWSGWEWQRIWSFVADSRFRWSWLLGVSLLPSCASEPINVPVGDYSQRHVRNLDSHRVRQGDTLYSVAFLYGHSVDELVAWNRLSKPYIIQKGQELRLTPPPATVKKSLPKPRPAKPAKPSTQTPRASQPKPYYPASKPKTVRPATPTAAGKARARPVTSRKVIWSWPANGRLISGYDAKSTGKKGINIAGKPDAPVHAAAAGKVVYAGSGLSGYGRLIIIKHNKDFLSAYAHNRKLIAREGQWVKKGEIISRMGRSGTDRTQLHFEIRKKGRPVNPLRYLPNR